MTSSALYMMDAGRSSPTPESGNTGTIGPGHETNPVKISSFGSFSVHGKGARIGRNPRNILVRQLFRARQGGSHRPKSTDRRRGTDFAAPGCEFPSFGHAEEAG